MDIFDEKQAVYEQMKLLVEERRKITRTYYELKQKLKQIEKQIFDSNSQNIKKTIIPQI